MKLGKHGDEYKDDAWFIGLPTQLPEIVVAALLENAEHGNLAADRGRGQGVFRQEGTAGEEAATERSRGFVAGGDQVMAAYGRIRDLDWPMVILALAISALGILQIYSATLDSRFETAWWKQGVWLGGGLIAMWLMSKVDYHTLLGQVPVLYGISIVLLILTPLIGRLAWGSKADLIGFGLFHWSSLN
jgi:hypothetical protein